MPAENSLDGPGAGPDGESERWRGGRWVGSRVIVSGNGDGDGFGRVSSSPAAGRYGPVKPTFISPGSRWRSSMWAKAGPTLEVP